MTLSPENKAIFDRLWRAEVEAGRSGDVSLNQLMDAARSEAKPTEVEGNRGSSGGRLPASPDERLP